MNDNFFGNAAERVRTNFHVDQIDQFGPHGMSPTKNKYTL